MIEAELPDGTILEFPDGTSQDVIQRTVKQRLGQTQPAPALGQAANPTAPMVTPTQRPSSGLSEATGGLVSRDAAIMAGGVIGGIAGAPLGPVGAAGGGALGAAGGSLVFDTADTALRWLEGHSARDEEPFDPVRRAINEGVTDLGFSAVLAGAGPLVKRGAGRLLGVFNEPARQMADKAAREGIDLGTQHVSPRKFVKGMPKVLGVFPFVGTPYRQGQAKVVAQINERAADLINTLAPVSSMPDVGKGLTEGAQRRFTKASRVASQLYDNFYRLADALPADKKAIVPTAPIKQWLSDLGERTGREAITLQSGEPAKDFGQDAIGEWMQQFSDLPDMITVEQARGLERALNGILRQAAKEGWDVSRLRGMKGALEQAKEALDVSGLDEGTGRALLDAWNDANGFFRNAMSAFESPTARRFGRVDKNIFGAGGFKPGTINADEAFDAVFRSKSPQALSDLRDLVGPNRFRQAGAKYLDDALQKAMLPAKEGSIVGDMFSAAKFEKQLGLDTREGRQMMGQLLEGSGVTLKDWDRFLDVAKKATDIEIRDPSTFLMRRIILSGGVAGVVGGLTMAGNKLSLPVSVVLSLVARQGSKFLMSPQALHDMTRIVSPKASDVVKRASFLRLLRLAGPDEEESASPRIELSTPVRTVESRPLPLSAPAAPLPSR